MISKGSGSSSGSHPDRGLFLQFTEIVKTHKSRPRGEPSKVILDRLEILLKGGQCVLLTGENGSGKSTLLRIMAGLLKPDSGFANTGLHLTPWKRARKLLLKHVMYLYQEPYMFDGSVYQNLRYAAQPSRKKYRNGKKKPSTENPIELALKWADLEHRKETEAKCLSGGERQRVALAQAWLKQPSVLLLDEPTANMDDYSRHRTEELLGRFKQRGTAILIASHDVDHFHQIMDLRLLLEEGKIINVDTINVDTRENRDKAGSRSNEKTHSNFPTKIEHLKNRLHQLNNDTTKHDPNQPPPYDD